MRSSLRPTCLVPSLAGFFFLCVWGEKELDEYGRRPHSICNQLLFPLSNSPFLLLTWDRIVVSDDLNVLAVARGPRVGDKDAVEGEVLFDG